MVLGLSDVLCLSHDLWLSYAANLEKPAATVQFGPILIGNGHFQSSTKLCRFAGTK